jgi:hypothetical protein
MPVIGFLSGVSFEPYADYVAAFRQGLMEIGFVTAGKCFSNQIRH